MITLAVIALIAIVGLLFAAMAIAPVLIESGQAGTSERASLVLVESPIGRIDDAEHSRAA